MRLRVSFIDALDNAHGLLLPGKPAACRQKIHCLRIFKCIDDISYERFKRRR